MKLNSRKKNTLSRFWMSIFFILAFYLFFTFFGENLQKIVINFRKNIQLYTTNNKEVLNENLELKKEIQNLKLKNIFSRYYYNKAKDLEKKLSFSNEFELNRKIFYLLPGNKIPFKNDFILENNNLDKKIGDLVYVFDNFVIGRISNISNLLINVKRFSDYGVAEDYFIITEEKVIFKGRGVGDSSGIIKMDLPRDIIVSKDSLLVLNDGKSIAGIFLRDDFKSQNTKREVYFRVIINPENILSVEI